MNQCAVNENYRKASRKTGGFLFVSATILLSFIAVAPSVQAANDSAPEKLAEVERIIIGSESGKGSIDQRLKSIELKVFGKVQNGSMTSRIAALEKFAGVKRSDFMPPIPPQFDNGKGPLKQAPERVVNTKKETPHHSVAKDPSGKPLNSELEAAVRLHHEGRENEAERSLKAILDHDPKNTDAYFSLGAIAETRGDNQAALEYYTLAMQANPNDSEARDAVAELSRKITAASTANNAPFVNPLEPPPLPPAAPNVLQGRAFSVNAVGGAGTNNLTTQTGITARPPIPTLPVSQPSRSSVFAKTLTRAALGAALSASGLHCPACHLIRGF